jgi:CheY-like chemotaxis protein
MLSILLADSDPVFMAEYTERLRRPSMAGTDPWPGYPVFTADNHADVWRLLETERPSVIILDITLPGGDSREFMRRIRHNPEYRATPVIMTYPAGEKEEEQEAADMTLGIDLRSYKPIAPRYLLRFLKRILESLHEQWLAAFVEGMHPLLQELFMVSDIDPRSVNPTARALRLAQSAPEEIATLVRAAMRVQPKGSIDFEALLALMPEEEWPALVAEAVTILKANPADEAAASLINAASFQSLQAVHPFLTELFLIDTFFETNIGIYVWREAGDAYLDFLTDYLWGRRTPQYPTPLQAENELLLRQRAFEALMETRHPEALRQASLAAPELGYSAEHLTAWLHQVDYEAEGDGFRRLVSSPVRHLQFPAGYIEKYPHLENWQPLPWQSLAPEDYTYRFGGVLEATCGFCAEPLHHLLTLDPIPEGLGITSVSRLALATCLACEGWEEYCLFFQHDDARLPIAYNRAETPRTPKFFYRPLVETQIAIFETPPRWRWQDRGESKENLHRLGGHPSWVQSAEYPVCPICARTMPFLMQLDSGLKLDARQKTEDGTLLWGSGGMAYFFWCDACRISAAMWQCT